MKGWNLPKMWIEFRCSNGQLQRFRLWQYLVSLTDNVECSVENWDKNVPPIPQQTYPLRMKLKFATHSMWDCTAVNKQHKHWHPTDTPSYKIHHIIHIQPQQTVVYSTRWKNHSVGENSLPLVTWREVVHDTVEVSHRLKDLYAAALWKLPDRWQKWIDLGGEYVKTLKCDILPVISWRLVTQLSVNHLRMTFVIVKGTFTAASTNYLTK